MVVEAVGIYFDYSKHRITDETRTLLLQLAEESGLRARIDAMFRGGKIIVTEKRAVLHVALRAPKGRKWPISPAECAVESGKAAPASRSTTSPISASVGLTWGR
jgi:glucose-6-phosphate isomerase